MRSLVSSSTPKGEENDGEEEEEDDAEEEEASGPSSTLDHSLSATAAARGHATGSRLLASMSSPQTHASPPMTREATPCGGPQETGEKEDEEEDCPSSSSAEKRKLLFRATSTAAVAFSFSPRPPPLQILPPFIPSVGSTAYL